MAALTDLSFADWVAHMFDHPASGPQWYADVDAPYWVGPPAVAIAYATRLFEDPLAPLASYGDAQVNQGLWYLISNGGSDCMTTLYDATVPLPDRVRCVRAFGTVFRDLFLPRCTPHLSHRDEPDCGALNAVCYMWWDLLPLIGAPEDRTRADLDRAALDVMTDELALPSVACQESALHGLGHWHRGYPREVESIVDAFLRAHGDSRPELMAYARSARAGCVQ
jgi:hypothetical protein